jgi:ribosomal protein L37E
MSGHGYAVFAMAIGRRGIVWSKDGCSACSYGHAINTRRHPNICFG